MTNLDAVDFRLVEAPIDNPSTASWQDLLPHRPGTRLFGIDAFADHLVAYEWADALPTLRVIRNDGTQFVIDQPEAAFALSGGTNLEYDTIAYRFNYQSLVTPPSIFDVDLRHRRADTAQAAARARRLRRRPVRDRPHVGHRERRHQGADLTRREEGLDPRRQQPCSALRLRLVRVARSRRGSRGRASACSTAAWCSPSPTCAGAASSAGAGTWTASCCTSATRSPTSSTCAEHLVAEGWTSAGPPGDPGRQRGRAAGRCGD